MGISKNERGAIVLMAVFMAVFLVAALRVLTRMGDAMLQHEQLMNGADGTAFAAAVYHARGMNIIVLLNLSMAALLTIVVVMRLILFVLGIVTASVCSSWWTLVTIPICSALTSFTASFEATTQTVAEVVDSMLVGITVVADGVALTMPFVAEGKAIREAMKHSFSGFMFSPSLMPIGCWGLPVSNAPFYQLCYKAGENVANVIFWPIPDGVVKKALTGALTSAIT